MKKLMFLMMALLVAPAMATITVRIVDNGDLTAYIMIDATDSDADVNGSLLAGIALDAIVDGGAQILAVSEFKATGESVVGDKGYGIYMGTITFTGGTPEEIADVGTPVAPDTAPDNPPQLPGPECTLEFGALYNVNTPEAAPEALGTKLCKIEVDAPTTLVLTLDETRGLAALVGGGAPSEVVFVGGAITGGVVDPCAGDAECQAYLDAGFTAEQLECWNSAYHCRGDVDGLTETFFKYRVYIADLNAIVDNWKKKITDPTLDPCSDIDHASETFFKYRCYINDLNTVVNNWKKKDVDLTVCP